MKKFLILLLAAFTITSGNLKAQNEIEDWDWQWGKSAEVNNGFRSLGIRTDFNNDIYSYYWYIDSITIGDTAFRHYGNYPNHQNFDLAIVKYNHNGDFIRAVDLYTTPHHAVRMVDIEIDKDSNIYIYGTYSDTLFVNNNIITSIHKGYMPNIFITKLSSDFQFIWGKTISSIFQDDTGGLSISNDNSIYISSAHHTGSNDSIISMIDYMGQDSAIIGKGLSSLIKIDSEGNLLWRQEIRDYPKGSVFIDNTLIGEDGYIYTVGNATDHIVIDGDTLTHPDYPNYGCRQYIVQYDDEGNHHNAFFVEIDHFSITLPSEVEVDNLGNFYVAGLINQSTIFGTDTITIPNDTKGLIVAKLDSLFQPIWSEYVNDYHNINIWFLIDLFEDKLAFATTGKGQFSFAGIDFSLGNSWSGIIALFDNSGELVSHQVKESTNSLMIRRLCIDNCGNFLFSGLLTGEAYFGDDTITNDLSYNYFHAKNYRNYPPSVDLPTDTSGCKELTLIAPDGYLYYKWNDELINQNWFSTTNTGIVNLMISNGGGCWTECDIDVIIFPEIIFSLGEDTTIILTDSLEINIDDS